MKHDRNERQGLLRQTLLPHAWTQFGLLLLAMVVAACGTINQELQQRVAAEAAGLRPSVEDDAAVRAVARRTASNRMSLPAASPLPEQAGLDDYIRIALRDNPSIRRAIREVQVLGYRVPQVTSLEDPIVSFVPPTGDMVQTAAGMLGGAVGLSQKIPFPGKLTTRGRIVEQSVRMALDRLADVRIRTVAQVKKAYYDYYLADVSIAITRESQALLRQIRDVAAARYRAGKAPQQDVLRAEVDLYNLTNELITLEQQRATAAALLNSLMDRDVEAPLPPPKPFDLKRVDWKLPALMARAIEKSPRLARLRDQVLRDLEAVRLARLDYFPDLTAGATYTFISSSGVSPVASGNDAWNLGFGLNLPIWWRKQRAQVLEGNAQVLASVEEYRETRNAIFFEIEDALVKIDTQYRQAVLFRDLIVPRAWQAIEASTSSYRAGALEFTALVENWRKWLDASLAYHRALAGVEQRLADLEQLVGVALPRLPEQRALSAPARPAAKRQAADSPSGGNQP